MSGNELKQVEVSFPLLFPALNPAFDDEGCYIFNKDSRFLAGSGETTGQSSLILFTNVTLANQFAKAANANIHIIDIETIDAAIELALRAKELHGCTRVAIDPPVRATQSPAFAIEDFVARLRSTHESN